MRTKELYEIQNELKGRIGYSGPDKFEKMMLAMMAEFMEAANEWRGFKYWSKDNNPRTLEYYPSKGERVEVETRNPLLEEYVDGLHLVLEAGLDLLEMELITKLPDHITPPSSAYEANITRQFKAVLIAAMTLDINVSTVRYAMVDGYKQLFNRYIALGKMLGFKDDEIIAAYKAKNEVNHERQENGY